MAECSIHSRGRALQVHVAVLLSLLIFSVSVAAQTSGTREVIQALNAVPVYFVTTASGNPPSTGYQNEPEFVPVFLYREEARIAKAELEQQGAKALKVVSAKLGSVYSGSVGENQTVRYGLVANPTQLAAAKLAAEDPSFNEMPVFIAKNRRSGEVLTMKQSDGPLAVPLFLEHHRLKAALAALGDKIPDLDGLFRIEAYPLSAVVSDMQSGALNPGNVVMIPPASE